MSEAKKKPRVSKEVKKRYRNKTTYHLPQLNRNTDQDIIEWLELKENKTKYLKDLIRADIKK